jgi:hypothetical protein
MRNQRLNDRTAVAFQVCVTVVANSEISASGEAQDISRTGVGVLLPIALPSCSMVRVDIADSVLYGFVTHSQEWPVLERPSFARNKIWSESSESGHAFPERRLFHTGIDIIEVVVGTSGLSRLLEESLGEALPNLEMASSSLG